MIGKPVNPGWGASAHPLSYSVTLRLRVISRPFLEEVASAGSK